jgi:hypothetical protein
MFALTRLIPLTLAGLALARGADDIKQIASEFMSSASVLNTTSEMQSIASLLQLKMMVGIPPPKDLKAFIEANTDPKPGGADDAWGQPYRLANVRGAWELRSCGADRDCGNKDDVVVPINVY